MKIHGKSQVKLCFLVSLIYVFSLYLNNSSRITFARSGGGPLPGPQGVRMGGGPLPGPQGVRRNMYGTAYVPTYYTVLRM